MSLVLNKKCVSALLPMKGHSERVPNKNIRDFCGQPLFFRVLETLDSSAMVDEIIINTDSAKIAEMALTQSEKVKIIRRPENLQGDFVPMNDILNFDLEHCRNDHILQTHSTNPLLRTETINRAIEKYFSDLPARDSLFSVTQWQTRLYWENGEAVNHDPKELLRTQDLPPLFEENSNIFVFSKDSFRSAGKRRIGTRPSMFKMDRLESTDIDEESDFILAEVLYSRRLL